MSPLAVIAVGGNALIHDERHKTVQDQYLAAIEGMRHVGELIQAGWDVVITHGNGPQVGYILRRSELSRHELHEVPLDSCGADTQGAIGYMFQKALGNELRRRGIARQAVTVVTQVLVDLNDPAFKKPSKPIGSFMNEADARVKMATDAWTMVEDAGRGWRRVVASPRPVRIIERDAIQALIDEGFVVIAVGGGGIPVMENAQGDLVGVEAVIDKDFGGALISSSLPTDVFLIATAVEKVAINFNKPNQQWLDAITVAEAKQYLGEGHFAPGSMKPKIEAAVDFVERAGKPAIITSLESLSRAVRGETGTRIVP
ncbi:MAG: carbamate kinase [Thermoflexales bacterium]|nr:carbamate kinase [Thermoflexales bacterium]